MSRAVPKPRPRVPRGSRPRYLDAHHDDALLAMALVLATELSVCHDRLETLEELLVKDLGVTRERIEALGRSAIGAPRRAERRVRLIRRLLRSLLEDAGELDRAERERRYRELVASLRE